MSEKLKVGILGATGMVGQRFITLLENHPWFEVVTLAASAHSAGKTYAEAIGDRWKMETPMPEYVKNMVVVDGDDAESVASGVDFMFSAVNMPKDQIRAIEERYAKTETPVVSNNSAHRWTPDVPMVVPEINPEHYEVIEHQKKRLGTTRGFIAVKPNCSIQAYTPALAAWKEFEPHEVIVSTYQAISGAGKTFKDWPEMVGNIIPFISGEEAKSEKEPLKVFGHVDEAKGEIVPFDGPLRITSQCIRVPVLNGHTATVFINFGKNPTKDELIDRLVNYTSKAAELGLPQGIGQLLRGQEPALRRQHAEKAALGQLRADELRLLLQALGDLRSARLLRQAAFRQLDELEGAVGLQPLGVFGGRLGIEFLLELAHADERDGKHKNLRVFKKPAHTDRFFA